jgi:hypothetical protein
MTRTWWLGLCAVVVLALAVASPAAQAEDSDVVYARVVVNSAALRTGPGAGFRIVRIVHVGDTFRLRERATRGYWFEVELPDGTFAWVQGDAVYTHEVGPERGLKGILGKLFAPPPLLAAHGEIALQLGVLGSNGLIAVRPSYLFAPTFALEANLGASVGNKGRAFFAGLGGLINVFPSWPVVPFFTIGGGVVQVAPNADAFVLDAGTRSMAYGGGGLRFGFRKRIIVRVEGRGYVFFNANDLVAQQEISGGLSAFF